MESVTSAKRQEEIRQAEIRKQIAALQAQLVDVSNTTPVVVVPQSPKRKRTDGPIFAPATPSPKRRKVANEPPKSRPLPSLATRLPAKKSKQSIVKKSFTSVPKPSPSKIVSKLASFNSTVDPDSNTQPIARSTGFKDRPTSYPKEDNVLAIPRDDRLTLVEDLEIGPVDHKPPFDDPGFEKLEPNSGIRLSSRALPHEEFQDYLRGRYYLSPSKLYSVVRLQPNRQGYDVPVEGDWVTIAVVAERGPLKYTKAPIGVGKDGQEEEDKEDTLDNIPLDGSSTTVKADLRKWKGKNKEQQGAAKPSGKRYINLKLIDFGCRSSSSSTAEKSVIRGDAFLSLLLFESDRVETTKDEGGKKLEIYHGGSRGAFERMAKLREGAVVALLNPKILKPFQRSTDAPHPTDNILALTPDSADSTVVIGYSMDLGMCKAVKRDGKVCGSWCDKRVSDVCEWHMTNAIKHNRASRPEFSIGTSGLSTAPKRNKPAHDPKRQWGLLPDDSNSGSGSTYVVSGHVISNRTDTRSLYVGETVGREAQAKAARASAKEADRALQKLLQRDKDGVKHVLTAREHEKERAKKDQGAAKQEKIKRKDKGKSAGKGKQKAEEPLSSGEDPQSADGDKQTPERHAKSYSARLIRNLGFDPTGKEGRKSKDSEVQKKLDALAALHSSKRAIDLGPRPGKKYSSVRAPTSHTTSVSKGHEAEKTVCLDSSSDEDFEQQEAPTPGREADRPATEVKMVNLDSSDVE